LIRQGSNDWEVLTKLIASGRHGFSRSKLVDDVDRGCDVSWDKVQGVCRENSDKKRGRAERSESSEYQDGVEFNFISRYGDGVLESYWEGPALELRVREKRQNPPVEDG